MGVTSPSFEHRGPRALTLALPGIDAAWLTPERTPQLAATLAQDARASAPLRSFGLRNEDEAAARFFEGCDSETLRLSGVAFDRRSSVVRMPWQSDQTFVDGLGDLPGGAPADGVWLELRDAGRAAVEHGVDSHAHRDALDQLDAAFGRVCNALRRGADAPVVTVLTLAAARPIERTFDPLAALSAGLRRRVLRHVVCEMRSGSLRVRCATGEALDRVYDALVNEPCVNHARVVPAGDMDAAGLRRRADEIFVVPRAHVAFGTDRRHAMLPVPALSGTALGEVSGPTVLEAEHAIDLRDLGAAWAASLTAGLVPVTPPATPADEPARAPDIASAPDLLPLLDVADLLAPPRAARTES